MDDDLRERLRRGERSWQRYYECAGDDPRPTLVEAAGRFAEPGLAVDLGAGTGRDTVELLRRGWRVVAIDGEGEAIERLLTLAGGPSSRLETRVARLEDAEWPACELVNASFALPFVEPGRFAEVWARIVDSLRLGGRFAGQLFGVRDEWADSGIVVHAREEIEALLEPFAVERLDEVDEEGSTAIGTQKHWHLFHVVARKR